MWPDHCVQDTYGAQFHGSCQPNVGDVIVSKGSDPLVDSYSGFGSTPETTILLADLESKNVTKLYVVGLAYDYCVGSTALDGAKYGFDTYVIMDATRAVSDSSAETMKKQLKNAGVIEIMSEDMLKF